ncbi:MAG: peptidoglycan endopeptidase, partial [Bombilactobacillus mellifer]|nr:peptidoglycan endopeptidase [Bombilactobacillus mellifer]
MKRKKLGYLSSGILGLASLTLLGVSNANHTHAATNGTINYKGGATTVWSSPEVGQTVKHYLNTGDKVSIQSSKKVFSETWYNLGNDEWVSSKYIDSNQVVAQPAAEVKADTVTANYKSGATTVWSDPESMAPTGEYLVYGATKKVLANKKVNNTTWYQIEGKGWVPETYVVLNNPSLTNVTPITVAPAVSKAEPAQQQPAEQPAAAQQPAQQQPAEQAAAPQQPAQQSAEQAAAPQQPAQQSAEQP